LPLAVRAHAAREKATLARHPDLVDLLVAAARDPITDRAAKVEFGALISPFALLSPPGFRRGARVRPDELRQLAMPTLVLWGEQDLVGSIPVARAAAELIPHARLEVLPTGHGPWLRAAHADRREGRGLRAVRRSDAAVNRVSP
jgi:pimeloyl-ACP methyl ester carboxylesterase